MFKHTKSDCILRSSRNAQLISQCADSAAVKTHFLGLLNGIMLLFEFQNHSKELKTIGQN